jgi:glycosyltransferase involved in cell wall biosynthesis
VLSRLSPRASALVHESIYTLKGWRFDDLKKHIDAERRETWASASTTTALEYTLRSASESRQYSSRVAFVTCLPPQDTGIATCSLYSWLGYEGPVDIFCPVADLDWFFYLSEKLTGPSGGGPRLFDVRGFLSMDRAVTYDHIVIAVGNSNHHIYVFELLKKLSSAGSLQRVTLYVHDPCLLNLIQRGAGLSSTTQLARTLGDIYEIKPQQIEGHDWVDHAALIGEGIFGVRYFSNFGIKRFLVNSVAAAEILTRDLAGTAARVDRIFHPAFLPVEKLEPQFNTAFNGISIGMFGIPCSAKRTDTVIRAVKRLAQREHNVRLHIAGFHVAQFAEGRRQLLEGIDCKVFDGPTDPQLIQCMQCVDVAVQLRTQNLGESTGIIPQLLHLGKSVITTDIGSFKEFRDAVRLISPNATEDDIADQIVDLSEHPIDVSYINKYIDEHTPICFQNQFSKLFGLNLLKQSHEIQLLSIPGLAKGRAEAMGPSGLGRVQGNGSSNGSSGEVAGMLHIQRNLTVANQAQSVFEHYVSEACHNIEGWNWPEAFIVLRMIKSFQDELGIKGGAVEIGVHHGRFFLGLHNSLPEGSHSLAIDVFDQAQNIDNSGCGNKDIFLTNIERYAKKDCSISIWQRDSLSLGPSEVIEARKLCGECRAFSIDGGHTPEHTQADFEFAQQVTAMNGVIFLDDFLNPHWPGVNNGISKYFFTQSSKFVPFAYCRDKLLFTSMTWHKQYLECLKAEAQNFKDSKLVKIFGHEVLALTGPQQLYCVLH